MIFITVGTHPQQFNRLLKKVDELIEKKVIREEVFAQIGVSDYVPKNYKFIKMMPLKEFNEQMKKAEIIIAQGGEGIIGTALQLNKKLIIVPRYQKFGEHTNDHQLELTKAVEEEKRAIAVYEIEELGKALNNIKSFEVKKFDKERKIIPLIESFVKEKGLK
ncbi:MAG: PssE/Cps14G family polysaccharide biosynthesis glycosyltransferase [archaeon]|nr:PssE/Cps14G family polysaccharide biosynthesis glycosyltransferase [archaeon]